MEPASTMAGASATTATGVHWVDWGAVIAGAAMAAALSVVLLAFGSAIGLSFTSPWTHSRFSAKTIASLAVFWTLSQQIGAAIAGGYIAGRMRSRWAGTAEHEVEFRDGLHGGLVWALSVVISAAVLVSAVGSISRTGTDIAARAATTVNPIDYYVDTLLRERAGTAPVAAVAQPPLSAETRAETVRIISRSIANGTLADTDRTYLANIVSRRSGLPAPDAEKRVSESFAEAQRVTKDAADSVRHAAVLTGFVTAAGLLFSLGAAWWAGQRGGHHRDNSIPARFPAFTAARRT